MDLFVATESTRPVDVHSALELGWRLRAGLRDPGLQQVFLAACGRWLLWHFHGADPGAVVAALHRLEVVPVGLWSGTARSLRGSAASVVVEHDEAAPAATACVLPELCLATHRVEPAGALESADGRLVLSFYRAPDTESVRVAQRHASLPAGRVRGLRRLF